MTVHQKDFPFEEIRRSDGNLFANWQEAKDAGFEDDQIWSVTSGDDGSWMYGPPHNYVNHLGHVATNERHDGNTYYEECFDADDDN